MNNITRRAALKLITSTGIAIYLSPAAKMLHAEKRIAADLKSLSPIDRTLPDIAPQQFYADEPERAHSVLWDKAGFIKSIGGKIPTPEKFVNIAIVGGGLSGLFTGYLLRKHNPLILEQAKNFGGNAKGQSWRGIDYSIGAAYLIEPEEETDIHNLLLELGVVNEWRLKESGDFVAINNRLLEGFWEGNLERCRKQAYHKLTDYFQKLNGELDGHVYPEIPPSDSVQLDYIRELDQQTFIQHLRRVVGGTLNQELETAIEQYCWSSFGASAGEISAAAGLNFLAAEFSSVAVLPGGNARVAELALQKLRAGLATDHLKNNCLTFHVEVIPSGVLISYLNMLTHKVHTLHAKKAVMACPKFVVNKILHDIEDERSKAIMKLQYRSYLVANVLISGSYDKDFYDLYMLGDADTDPLNTKVEAEKQKVTDVILANFASANKENTVLTLYRALPYDGARVDLYMPDAYAKFRSEFKDQIQNSILPLLNINKDRVVDVRIARWGHPLPVARVGLIADGTVDQLRKPFKDKVFFVEQDNWALPAFETAASEAIYWSKIINKI